MRITQKKDNHSMITAKCLQDDFISDFGRSEFSSLTKPPPAILDSSSLSTKKRPALLFKTNLIIDEIQLGISLLISCSLRNKVVKINAKVANAEE